MPAQRIKVEEALTAYTATNAYAGFQDDRLAFEGGRTLRLVQRRRQIPLDARARAPEIGGR